MRLITLLLLLVIMNGCRIQNNFKKIEPPPKTKHNMGAEPIQKTVSTAGYINGVIFQRVPIKPIRNLGNILEGLTTSTYYEVVEPIDGLRRFEHERFSAKFQVESDYKSDSFSICITITW